MPMHLHFFLHKPPIHHTELYHVPNHPSTTLNAIQSKTHDSKTHDSTAEHITSTTHHSTAQHITTQHNTSYIIQYDKTHNTANHTTAQNKTSDI